MYLVLALGDIAKVKKSNGFNTQEWLSLEIECFYVGCANHMEDNDKYTWVNSLNCQSV